MRSAVIFSGTPADITCNENCARRNAFGIGNERKQHGVASRGTRRLLVASRVERQLTNTRERPPPLKS